VFTFHLSLCHRFCNSQQTCLNHRWRCLPLFDQFEDPSYLIGLITIHFMLPSAPPKVEMKMKKITSAAKRQTHKKRISLKQTCSAAIKTSHRKTKVILQILIRSFTPALAHFSKIETLPFFCQTSM
jgi:hypothetical protein